MNSGQQQRIDIFLKENQRKYVRSLCKQHNLTYSSFFRIVIGEIMDTMSREEIGLILSIDITHRHLTPMKTEDY